MAGYPGGKGKGVTPDAVAAQTFTAWDVVVEGGGLPPAQKVLQIPLFADPAAVLAVALGTMGDATLQAMEQVRLQQVSGPPHRMMHWLQERVNDGVCSVHHPQIGPHLATICSAALALRRVQPPPVSRMIAAPPGVLMGKGGRLEAGGSSFKERHSAAKNMLREQLRAVIGSIESEAHMMQEAARLASGIATLAPSDGRAIGKHMWKLVSPGGALSEQSGNASAAEQPGLPYEALLGDTGADAGLQDIVIQPRGEKREADDMGGDAKRFCDGFGPGPGVS